MEAQGKNPLQLDSKGPSEELADYAYNENRFKILTRSKPQEAKRLMDLARQDAVARRRLFEQLAALDCSRDEQPAEAPAQSPQQTQQPQQAAR